MPEQLLTKEDLQGLGDTRDFWKKILNSAGDYYHYYLMFDSPDHKYASEGSYRRDNIFTNTNIINPLLSFLSTGNIQDGTLEKLSKMFESKSFGEAIGKYEGKIPEPIKKLGGIEMFTRLFTEEKCRKQVEQILQSEEATEELNDRLYLNKITTNSKPKNKKPTLADYEKQEEEIQKKRDTILEKLSKDIIQSLKSNSIIDIYTKIGLSEGELIDILGKHLSSSRTVLIGLSIAYSDLLNRDMISIDYQTISDDEMHSLHI